MNPMTQDKVVLHRDFEGDHETETGTADCWCKPLVIDADDLRDADDIRREIEKADG